LALVGALAQRPVEEAEEVDGVVDRDPDRDGGDQAGRQVQADADISQALGVYIEKLKQFKSVIDNRDLEKSYELMRQANDIRRILKS
jgi:hypothetical protein